MVVDAAIPNSQIILTTTTIAILLSVIAHGITANWLSISYGRWERNHVS
jgi:NhaP-type Na+/H+ or K+/H+ antiporter